jgi:hypothetical protein
MGEERTQEKEQKGCFFTEFSCGFTQFDRGYAVLMTFENHAFIL